MNSLARVVVIALLSSLASIAQAKDLEHNLHFSIDTGLVGWDKRKIDAPVVGQVEDKALQVGFPNSLGAHIGFLPIEVLEAGLRVSFRYEKHDRDGDKYSSSANDVLAYARYVMRGGSLRPFLGPVIGVSWFSNANPGEDNSASTLVDGTALTVGGELGVYGFVLDGLSLDPMLSFLYQHGNARAGAAIPNLIGGGVDYDVTGFQLMFGLSVSGWLRL